MRISVILCFILSIPACALFQSREATAIERILAADRALFEAAAAEVRSSGADPLEYYVEGLNSISLEGAPPDFRSAWINHVSAWEDVQRQVEERTRSQGRGLFASIIGFFIGNPAMVAGGLIDLLSANDVDTGRAHRSWCRIAELSRLYGARLPQSSRAVAGNFKVNPPEEPECL